MTAPQPLEPAPAPAPPPQQLQPLPPPPPDQLTAEDAVVALLAAYVAAQAVRAVNRAALTPARLVAALMRLGIPRPVARATLRLALEAGVHVPAAPTGPGAAAQRATARAEPIWRARYLLNAAKRMGKAYLHPPRRPGQRPPATPQRPLPLDPPLPGSGPGQRDPTTWEPERMTPAEAARAAFEAERRHLEQHREAQRNRLRAASEIDAAAAIWGQVLGWNAERDLKTTWDCARLHGKNFRVDDPPHGYYPGAMHPRCRCRPGPPWSDARIVGRTGV